MTDKTPTATVLAAGPPRDPASDVLASIETESGYSLIIRREGETFEVVLTSPDGRVVELHRWRSLERVYETLAAHFAQLGLPHVWVALRASVEAELRQ